jgi:hypothetical protein
MEYDYFYKTYFASDNSHYGHLWRQIFFAEGGTQLSDNLPLLFRLNLLQGIFTDHELHDLCILVDVKNTLNQLFLRMILTTLNIFLTN